MSLSAEEKMEFYGRQARFTSGIRRHVYRMIGLAGLSRVIDVGSGAGAVAREIAESSGALVVALEKELDLIKYSACGERAVHVAADATGLPFGDNCFDAALAHFVFMWIKRPEAALVEMKRVVRPGGWIGALAEPDYGGWIDHPEGLEIGRMLADSLIREGADPNMGRKLTGVFRRAGLAPKLGISSNIWDAERLKSEFDEEWKWRFKMLGSSSLLEKLKERERKAIESGERVLFVPIFYAFARNI